jgi:hypothetical protein
MKLAPVDEEAEASTDEEVAATEIDDDSIAQVVDAAVSGDEPEGDTHSAEGDSVEKPTESTT